MASHVEWSFDPSHVGHYIALHWDNVPFKRWPVLRHAKGRRPHGFVSDIYFQTKCQVISVLICAPPSKAM